jgi:sugar fermentation stimulation protein A
MIFKEKLISGEFIKRYKRFFADVKIGKNIVTSHCPNTGSMMGLLKKGNKVWLSKSTNPKRKLKYTLQIIEHQKSKVGINTHLTNKIVFDALVSKSIQNFKNFKHIKREVKFGLNTRFDFLIIEKTRKTFIEVKNVTLSRQKSLAEFPDAVTARGLKHISELLNAKQQGYEIYLLYVIQRDDCNKFKIASDIDPEYNKFLLKAVKKKLNILCYDCKFSSKGIKLNRKIQFKIK